jgi:hypothetical protein
MKIELLKRFCDQEKGEICSAPFVAGGNTYATNRRIAIRLKGKVPGVMDGERFKKNVDVVFAYAPSKEGAVFQPIPQPVCQKCKDEGFVTCKECGHKTQCDCRPREFSDIGNRRLATQYLALLRLLPGVKIAPNCGGEYDPMWFEFADGDGLLMPMKK